MYSSNYTTANIQDLINQTARQANILPLTSKCDSACIFCSHHNNPPQVQIISVGERSYADIIDTMSFLDPYQTITIGESASNIIEGEPTTHKDFIKIMRELRLRFPHTPVSLTTNGHHMTEELAAFLSDHQPIYINLSVNSSSLEGHRTLMCDSEALAKRSIGAIRLLDKYHIPFSCSMVGMPNVTGFEDIRRTVQDIAHYGADSIQMFMPGFSSFAKKDIFPNPDSIYQDLKAFVDEIAPQVRCPVLLEPSCVQDLRCIVSGIRKGSPAWNAGIRRGDEILSVNTQIPYSRTEAFQLLNGAGTRHVTFRQNGTIMDTSWMNSPDGSCGITMEYDFDKDRAHYMEQTIAAAPGKVLALSSEFAYPLIQKVVERMSLPNGKCDIVCTKNITFGGTIRAAGLLCYQDYVNVIEQYAAAYSVPDALVIPAESFNYLGRDLTGHHFSEIGHTFDIPVALV